MCFSFAGDCTQTLPFSRSQVLDLSPTALKKTSSQNALSALAAAASGAAAAVSGPSQATKVLLCTNCALAQTSHSKS
jgi:hypothetical protein